MGAGSSNFAIENGSDDGKGHHSVIAIHHANGNTADYIADFIIRKLNEIGIQTSRMTGETLKSINSQKVVLFLVNSAYNEWADDNAELLKALLEKDIAFLPIVIEDEQRNPSIWSTALKLTDRFYVDIIPNKEDGKLPAEKLKELQEKVKVLSGFSLSNFHISCHGHPNWRSHVEKDNFSLDNGFRSDVGSCGGGGIFQAFAMEVSGMKKIEYKNDNSTVTFWAPMMKTNVNQLEWRVFHVPGKMMITSRRNDTAPGWSIKELFYAPGTPTIGCNQGQLTITTKTGIKYHVFNSHNWSNGNHKRVVEVHNSLCERGILSWLDEERLNELDPILEQLNKGINLSGIVIVYITTDYVNKVSGDNDLDNCKREMMIYEQQYKEGHVQLIFAIAETTNDDLEDPKNWGALTRLVGDNTVVSLKDGNDALAQAVMTKLGLKPMLFYITMQEWKSYVQKGSFYTEKGFVTDGSCGAGGIFEAYEDSAPGLVKLEVEGATCYVCPEKVSLLQLEWRSYTYQHEKYLVTSNRCDMAPGWTFLTTFYARGVPSNGCVQTPTIVL